MLDEVDRNKIIIMRYVDNKSMREIARELRVSRNTVRKIINEYETVASDVHSREEMSEYLTEPRKYNSSNRTQHSISDEYQKVIHECLHDNEVKRMTGLKKQCMLKQDIYELLVKKGFTGSYSTVCRFIRKVTEGPNKPNKEAFIRIYYNPGEHCEFDWGEVKLKIRGKNHRFFMAVFTFSHSNGRWAYLFRHQNTLAYKESHRNFFRDINGVPEVMVYDNMKVAVKDFVGNEKRPTLALQQLQMHYLFKHRFCNARAGWEKGHVEKSVEYVRRKAFCVLDSFDSIEEAQHHLSLVCDELNSEIGSISTAEKLTKLKADLLSLKPFPGDIGCFERLTYTVDKWSTITYENNHYSVPDKFVGEKIDIKVYSEKIVIMDGREKVGTHERFYQKGCWSVLLDHYLNTLIRKPGAIKSSLALHQMPPMIKELFDRHFVDKGKDFVLMLQYARENGFTDSDIIAAYDALKKKKLRRISAEQIKTMLHSSNDTSMIQPPRNEVESRQNKEINDCVDATLNMLTGLISNPKNVSESCLS